MHCNSCCGTRIQRLTGRESSSRQDLSPLFTPISCCRVLSEVHGLSYHKAKILEYSPFLINLFFRLVRLATKMNNMPKAVVGYISLLRKLPGRNSEVNTRRSASKSCSGWSRYYFASRVDFVDNLQPAEYNFTFVIDTRKYKVVPVHRIITITGWAVDEKAGTAAGGVSISVNGKRDIAAFYGLDRPDVADVFKNSQYRFTGFSASLSNFVT